MEITTPAWMPRPGLPPAALRRLVRQTSSWTFAAVPDWPVVRARLDASTRLPPPPIGTRVSERWFGDVEAEVVEPPIDDEQVVVVLLHGGGYVVGSPRGYRGFAGRFAAAMRATVIVPEYRLAPEHPYPAALQDAVSVVRAVRDGFAAGRKVVLAGDSAGGGLALATAIALREADEVLPDALGLICPLTDLRPATTAGRSPTRREVVLTPALTQAFARAYVGDGDPANPLISPVLAELTGLPPTVVHVNGDDLIADDGRLIAGLLGDAGVRTIFSEHPDLFHDAQLVDVLLAGPAGQLTALFADDVRAALHR